jgi:hypothetical protein
MSTKSRNPRPKNSKRFQKSVKAIVQEELKQEIEEKHAITDYSVDLDPIIPSGLVVNGLGNFFKILPNIQQSTTGGAGQAYSERIGNEIRLKEIDITGFLTYRQQAVLPVDYKNGKLAVRVMILRAKEFNSAKEAFNAMPTFDLLRFGLQSGVSGTDNYDAFPLSSFRDINRDTFSVRYDKVHYLTAPVQVPGTNLAGDSAFSLIPSSAKIFRKKLTFGNRGLKLNYTNTNDVEANNFPYFMVVGYSSMTQNAAPDPDLVNLTMSCVGKYSDA